MRRNSPRNPTTFRVALLLLLLWVLPSSGSAEPPGADTVVLEVGSVLERVAAAYADGDAIQARFSQTVAGAMGGTQDSSGAVVLAPPARMRWTFEVPDQRAFVSDGTQLWIWLPEDRQVQHMSQLPGGQIARMYGFVYGLAEVEDDFTVHRTADTAGANRLVLTPRTGEWGVRDVVVLVDKTSGFVVMVGYTDDFGTRTTTRFSGHEVLPEVTDALFQFQAPDGAEVVEL